MREQDKLSFMTERLVALAPSRRGARTSITCIGDQGPIYKAKQLKPDLDIEPWQELGLLRAVHQRSN